MADMAAGADIEFLDTDARRAPSADVAPDDKNSGGWPLQWLVAGVVLVLGAWFVTSTGSDAPLEETVSDTPQPTPPAPIRPAPAPPAEPPAFGVWPTARERDPSVTRTAASTPLPSEFSAETLQSTTLVYVSTSGLPTVVSLETGEVSVVGVGATRIHDTFAVEAGQVVPIEAAAERVSDAFVFHTYRDIDRPGVGIMSDQRGIGVGPELCLSGETCAGTDLGIDRMFRSGFVVERLEPRRHRLLDELLTSWEPVDGSLLSPGGYRIPEPVGFVWVISPTTSGEVSSSGLL